MIHARERVLALDGVQKTYGVGDAALTVLHGIDFAVDPGEFVGIIGASGSGKSTLLNILGCLDRPTQGSYVLGGQNVSSLNDDRLSAIRNEMIGFIFQSFQLVPQLTVMENVELPLYYMRVPRRDRHARCLKLLEAVGLDHRLKHYPPQLSGGERQRAAIARALVNEPKMLLADEPTGNLDSKSGDEVMQLFRELHAEGRTILMVTHNPEIAAELPRVIEIKDGRVLRDGPREKAQVTP